ncbi:MAG: hypothetical protein E7Z69_06905 [Thermoplasmata archaeon]|nr:hypothetical protein [Thermoplasmata archaeon]
MSSLDQDIQFTLVRDFIFLTETHIAGLRYTPDLDDILADIYVKMSLRAYLEVDNEYDEDAVVIVDNKNRKIGHIPRPKNQIIANLIRAGKDIECTVEQIGTFRGEPMCSYPSTWRRTGPSREGWRTDARISPATPENGKPLIISGTNTIRNILSLTG